MGSMRGGFGGLCKYCKGLDDFAWGVESSRVIFSCTCNSGDKITCVPRTRKRRVLSGRPRLGYWVKVMLGILAWRP